MLVLPATATTNQSHQPTKMKTAQKTVTINGIRYTAARLRKLAKKGVELTGGDIAVTLACTAEIAVRDYGSEGIAVLNWGGINRKNVAFGGIVAFLA